jgi:thiamine-phosphate pyrophosphorylase
VATATPLTLPPLYAIVDEDVAARAGLDPVGLAERFLRGGARLLQLRAKSAPSGRLLEWARAIAARAREAGAAFVVNDRADVARMAGCGVHVGQDDLPPAAVRRLAGPDVLVGLSTHTVAQIEAGLREPVSYLAVGPVYGTATKETGYAAVGLDLVREAARRAGTLPVVAIGGITLERAPEVIAAGAAAVAVISDLVVGGDPEARARAFVAALEGRATV